MSIVAATPEAIEDAARRLRDGGLVALPTETVYGLGADAEDPRGVAAIYATKGRPPGHPLIVHVAGADEAAWWADWNEAAARLAARFWPGPLTLILPRREDAPAHACGDESTIGLRAPAHPVARALLEAFHARGGRGIAAPSANRFGRISPTRAAHVQDDLGDLGADAPLILDGGEAPVGIESTIVDLSRGGAVLLRPGAIGPDALSEALGAPVTLSVNVDDPSIADEAAPRAAGTLASHYAPRTPMRLLDPDGILREIAAHRARGERIAALRFDDGRLASSRPHAERADIERRLPKAPAAYAQALYAALRELDAAGCALILAEPVPDDPAWQAVRDRLSRAAAPAEG